MNAWLQFYVLLWSWKKSGCVQKEVSVLSRDRKKPKEWYEGSRVTPCSHLPFSTSVAVSIVAFCLHLFDPGFRYLLHTSVCLFSSTTNLEVFSILR